MRNDPNGKNVENEKPAVTLPGVVEKIVKPTPLSGLLTEASPSEVLSP